MNRIPELKSTSLASIRQWMEEMHDAELMFFTEDDPANIIRNDTGEPSFNSEEVIALRQIIGRIRMAIGEETEGIALEVVLSRWPTP